MYLCRLDVLNLLPLFLNMIMSNNILMREHKQMRHCALSARYIGRITNHVLLDEHAAFILGHMAKVWDNGPMTKTPSHFAN